MAAAGNQVHRGGFLEGFTVYPLWELYSLAEAVPGRGVWDHNVTVLLLRGGQGHSQQALECRSYSSLVPSIDVWWRARAHSTPTHPGVSEGVPPG